MIKLYFKDVNGKTIVVDYKDSGRVVNHQSFLKKELESMGYNPVGVILADVNDYQGIVDKVTH